MNSAPFWVEFQTQVQSRLQLTDQLLKGLPIIVNFDENTKA